MSRNDSARGWHSALGVAVVAAAMVASGATAQSTDRQQGRAFLGLWKGIDPLDGSTVQLSITNADDDDVLEILWRESFFSVCFGLGPEYSLGRGLITGEARSPEPHVLELEGIVTCISDDNVPVETVTFVNNIILEGRLLVISSGVEEFPDILLHRGAR